MTKNKIKRKIKQIKSLTQYRDYSSEELEKEAIRLLEEEEKYKVEWIGFDKSEIKRANKLYSEYLEHYPYIESFSDLEDLKLLVSNVVLLERLDTLVYNREKTKLSKYDIDARKELANQILNLKDKLGLSKVRKREAWKDIWTSLKKRIIHHLQSNRGAFEFKCPHCGEFALLAIKIKDYNTFPFKFFKGTFLYNYWLFKMMEEGKITKNDLIKIFDDYKEKPKEDENNPRLSDYIDWIYKKVYLKEKNQIKSSK